jgi:hypothetical protein
MRSLAKIAWLSFLVLWFGFGNPVDSNAYVLRDGNNVFIVDRTGEKWDVAQAVALGFDPQGFQFGIGRDSIQPLDESNLDDKTSMLESKARVIGVENGPDAHAYVVRKLTRHEIANTHLGEVPIAAAY